jgi:hypothetical protein
MPPRQASAEAGPDPPLHVSQATTVLDETYKVAS